MLYGERDILWAEGREKRCRKRTERRERAVKLDVDDTKVNTEERWRLREKEDAVRR